MLNKIASWMDSATGRLIRSAASLGISMLVARYKDNQLYISLTPILQASSKFLRDRFPNTLWEVLPF